MTEVKDPVCGMMVNTDAAPAKGVYDGRWVYICSGACQKTYESRQAQK